MLIEIKGVQFVNKGAELMLHAVLQQLKEQLPDAEVALAPNPYSPYLKRAQIGAYQKWSIRKRFIDLNRCAYWLPKGVRHWLKRTWGIVTEADIDVVLDASGFAYGDQWKPILIHHLCDEVLRANRCGKKYVFLPQALGPFTRDKDVAKLKEALPAATLVCAREESSYQHVVDVCGEQGNLHLFPDFTNLVVGECPEYYTNGKDKVLFIPNSNMVHERNKKKGWKDRYLATLIHLMNCAKDKGLTPVLLNHEGKGDDEICQSLKQSVDFDVEVLQEDDPIKVKGIIGESAAVVCSRFHGCVSALSQSVPCLGTSWSHKYERLFEEYGVSNYLLTPELDKSALTELMDNALSSWDVTEASDKFKQQAREMWAEVITSINHVSR